MGAVLTDMTDPTQLATVAPNHGVAGVSNVEIFGPPPLLENESQETYDTLLSRVTGAVNPKDIIEEIWVYDIVDLVWEILRLRGLKLTLLSASAGRGLEKLYQTHGQYDMSGLIAEWSVREPLAVAEVERF